MTLEHDHDRDRHKTADDARLRDTAVPGRASRSAALNAPTSPLISGLLMRKGSGGSVGGDASADVDRALSSGGGRGLPDDLRGRFEGSLGTDLSGVRIHEGAESQAAASSVAAKAFTVGNDIHFGAGQYDPGSPEGQHLIAHEVAHTVQQRGGSPMRQNKLRVSQSSDSFEVAADRAADAMVAGAPASLGGASIGLARSPDDDKEAQDKSNIINGARNTANGKDGSRSFTSGQSGLTIAGKTTSLTFGPGGISGSLTLGKKEWPLGTKFSQTVNVPVIPGTGVFMNVGVGLQGGIDAKVTATGAPPTADTITGTITGSASASLDATGRITVGAFVGAPLANLNAGGFLELAATGGINLSVGGEMTVKDDGAGAPKTTGKVTITGTPGLQVVGSGGITVGYCAVVTEGKLYEHKMGSLPVADISYPVSYTYDFGTKQGKWGESKWDIKLLPLQLGAATARPLGDAGKFLEKTIAKAKEKKAQADQNLKDHRLDHGVDDENQQTHNIPPEQQPEDCTHPDDLSVAPDPEKRPKPRTWVDVVS